MHLELFDEGLKVGDIVWFANREHRVRKIIWADPKMTGTDEKYCECVCVKWGGVYKLTEKRLLQKQEKPRL